MELRVIYVTCTNLGEDDVWYNEIEKGEYLYRSKVFEDSIEDLGHLEGITENFLFNR